MEEISKRRLIIEFYPELNIKSTSPVTKDSIVSFMIVPSRRSLILYSKVRSNKRIILNIFTKMKQNTNKSQLVLIKRFTGLKRYRMGAKMRIRGIPAVIFDKKLITEGNAIRTKEMNEIMQEILKLVGLKINV
jgi:hypothetical protein